MERDSFKTSLSKSILELADTLEQGKQNKVQQETFLSLSEANSALNLNDSNLAGSFIAILVSIVTQKDVAQHVVRSLKVLHTYLLNDATVFKSFKPNKMLLKKMELTDHVLSANQQESEAALELCAFIMRYHRSVDYADFSDSPFMVQRLRRFLEFKQWAEIEELQNITDSFSNKFDLFKASNHNAFQEILAYLDRITKEFTHQD